MGRADCSAYIDSYCSAYRSRGYHGANREWNGLWNFRRNGSRFVWWDLWRNIRWDLWRNIRWDLWWNIRWNLWRNVWRNIWRNLWRNVWRNVWRNIGWNLRRDFWWHRTVLSLGSFY